MKKYFEKLLISPALFATSILLCFDILKDLVFVLGPDIR